MKSPIHDDDDGPVPGGNEDDGISALVWTVAGVSLAFVYLLVLILMQPAR